MIETLNPATGEVIAGYETHDGATLEHLLSRAWDRWRDDWQHRALVDDVPAVAGCIPGLGDLEMTDAPRRGTTHPIPPL